MLEDPDCPSNYWLGNGSADDPNNWSGGVFPSAGDDVVFWFREYSGNCVGFHGPAGGGAYRSVTLVAEYGQKVTLAAGFKTESLYVYSGVIDQPSSGTDITVGPDPTATNTPGYFEWTGGTINSTTHPANVSIQDGTAATIDPGGGTVTTGNTLSFENGAAGTINAGTINFNNGSVYNLTGTGTNVTIDTSLGDVVFQQPAPPPAPQPYAIIGVGTTMTVRGGNNNPQPSPIDVRGHLDIIGGATLTDTGGSATQYSVATHSNPNSGTISIENGSMLRVSNGVGIGAGGVLQTLSKAGAGQDQRGLPATIDGKLDLRGGDLWIDVQFPHIWGMLYVTGNVNWTGGTFHVYVDPNAANNNFDQWLIGGSLTVTVNVDGNGNPVAGAPSIDVLLQPGNAPAQNQVWRGFIYAANGITRTNNRTPTANNPFTVAPNVDGKSWDLQT